MRMISAMAHAEIRVFAESFAFPRDELNVNLPTDSADADYSRGATIRAGRSARSPTDMKSVRSVRS
ncbi:MAG: hypothetical protein AAGG48_17670 [Planctomycetota bacterium]